ncbi:hypothetical protein T484DRAFT_1908939 [Baffinella frigidus]|nr:hypothetical protein T484DRAFT_1908939 [Cryptophyta sp. CCMP2293]
MVHSEERWRPETGVARGDQRADEGSSTVRPTFADKFRLSDFLVYSGSIGEFSASHICAALCSMAKLVHAGQRLGSEEKKFAEALMESFNRASSSVVVVDASALCTLLRSSSRLGIVPRPAVQHDLLDRLSQSLGCSGVLDPFERDNVLRTCEEWGVEPSGNLKIALGLRTAPHLESPLQPAVRETG